MWAAVGVWALLDGGGAWRWATFGVVTVLAVVGTVAALTLSGRKATDAGAPVVGAAAWRWWGRSSGSSRSRCVGIVVGAIAGLWLAELIRLRDPRTAWDTTWAALQGYGLGTVVQMAGRRRDRAGLGGRGRPRPEAADLGRLAGSMVA